MLIPYFLISFFIFVKITGDVIHEAPIDMNTYGMTLTVLFPFILVILIFDLKNINIQKFNPSFFSNLFIITCITGIIQMIWQIHSCFEFDRYVAYIQNLVTTSKKTFIEIPKTDYQNLDYLRFYTSYGIVHQSVFLNNDNSVENIIIPSSYKNEEQDWNSPARSGYNEKEDYSKLQDAMFFDKHKKYIDVSAIIKTMTKRANSIKQNKKNKINNI